jgi:NAD(P)H-flavin reductase/hemoglobin-like flavoprotein
MSPDAQLITESWAAIEPRAERVARFFYARIFHDHPDARDMFPVVMDVQRERLVAALLRIVRGLSSPENLAPYLAQLGRDHRKFGVRAEDYALVGESLVAALREYGGLAWTPEVEAAWVRALGKVATVMVDAATRAEADEPPWWNAQVVRHERRAQDVAVLTLLPDQPMRYVPGQYLTLETPRRPRLWRPYSIANAPRPDGTIDLHVKAVPGGWVSRALVHHTVPGDVLRLGAPTGPMSADPASGRDVVCVAGGTGLAPVKAIVEEMARWNTDRQVTVFVGARRSEELYDLAALNGLTSAHAWLEVVPAVSEEHGFTGESGPVADVFADNGSWCEHDVYVAGSPEMIRYTLARCGELRLPLSRIRYDGLIASCAAEADRGSYPTGPVAAVPVDAPVGAAPVGAAPVGAAPVGAAAGMGGGAGG